MIKSLKSPNFKVPSRIKRVKTKITLEITIKPKVYMTKTRLKRKLKTKRFKRTKNL